MTFVQITAFMVLAIIAACLAAIMFQLSLSGVLVGTYFYYDEDIVRVSLIH